MGSLRHLRERGHPQGWCLDPVTNPFGPSSLEPPQLCSSSSPPSSAQGLSIGQHTKMHGFISYQSIDDALISLARMGSGKVTEEPGSRPLAQAETLQHPLFGRATTGTGLNFDAREPLSESLASKFKAGNKPDSRPNEPFRRSAHLRSLNDQPTNQPSNLNALLHALHGMFALDTLVCVTSL
jgi:hypothetical protein